MMATMIFNIGPVRNTDGPSKIGFMVPGRVPGCFVEVAIVALVTLVLHVIHASGRNQALAQHFEAEK